ncbi:MAG: Crp/Fnr family transcriptional regulator [Terracidiphilus sp.]
MSSILSLAHVNYDRVFSESEDSLRTSTYKNTLLKALEGDVIERLRLQPVKFELKHEIEIPGNPIDHLYFLEEGMASMTTTFKDGSQVEVGMFGYESVIGVSALMGTKKSLNRVYTQIAGRGYSCRAEDARREFRLGGGFQFLALRYVQAQLVQAMQSAGCNAKHNFEQRLARWLLLCADRAHTDTFKISHEFLANMLGGRRPTITTTAGILKRKGLIEYTRGEIRILDVPGLTKASCECYLIIKDHLDNYAEFDTAITA